MRKVDWIEYPIYKKRLKVKIKVIFTQKLPPECIDHILSYTSFRWCLKKRKPRIKVY